MLPNYPKFSLFLTKFALSPLKERAIHHPEQNENINLSAALLRFGMAPRNWDSEIAGTEPTRLTQQNVLGFYTHLKRWRSLAFLRARNRRSMSSRSSLQKSG